jgi:ADP-ribose pyrophosphatase YjhB (NUDIX family)
MTEALSREITEERGPRAQVGKLLCVSETIFPDGSRHSVNLVYRGLEVGGQLKPSSDVRMAGKEFVDLRKLNPARSARPAAGLQARNLASGLEGGEE